jgi:DNA-binding GntR family transcriptional regulator
MTVRQALASLAARGLVERGVGRGTLVRTPQVVRVARAAGGTPVEYAHDRHRGDRARFMISVVPDALLARAL